MSADWFQTFFTGLALELWRKAMPPEITAAEAAFLEEALALGPGAAVLDVPCGNGRLALELAGRGHRVTGVDIAAEFIAEARAAASAGGLRISWHTGDMRELGRLVGGPPEHFDAAFCFGNSFGYFDRPGTADFLAALAGMLRPGGRLAIDTGMAAESFLPQLDERTWMPVDDMYLLVSHDYDVADSRLDTEYTFIRGGQAETRQACHWIFTVGEIGQMLDAAGFVVRELSADLQHTPYTLGAERLLIVAERGEP